MTGFFDIMKAPPIKVGEPYPMFTRVSIETSGSCTRDCRFCPSRSGGGPMHHEIYSTIIQQLEDMKFAGVVQMFLVNEPLGDPYIFSRVRELRQACPKCCIHITSNGDLLYEADTIHRLFRDGVNSLNFNGYDADSLDRLSKLARLADLQNDEIELGEHCWKKLSPNAKHLSVDDRIDPDRLHTWGREDIAQLNAGKIIETVGKTCARPHRHLVIDFEGDVLLCCAVDPNNTITFGNVMEQSLVNIWNTKPLHQYRWFLQNGQRVGSCSACVERMAFPHIVRKVEEI